MPFERKPIKISNTSSVLIILPPFLGIDRPYLGLHTLQAYARRAGFDVNVVYANVSFAAELGRDLYNEICYESPEIMLGEQVFSGEAFGLAADPKHANSDRWAKYNTTYEEIRAHASDWTKRFVEAVVAARPKIVGCNSTFEQTAASFSILRLLRQLDPQIVTLLGGANCDGPMGSGLAGLYDYPDYVFSGESEASFVSFLAEVFAGRPPKERLIASQPVENVEAIPRPDYADYYQAIEDSLEGGISTISKGSWMPYQSSRGCWWGAKHHCTFCGLNDVGMNFREKKADTVLSDLDTMLESHPNNKVFMVDSIMPTTYFKDMLPSLIKSERNLEIFYEQKANLSLDRVEMLVNAGVTVIQPGIEALSTSLLRRMDKGVSGPQNLALLRFGRATGLGLFWNLIYAFPGDNESDYEETLALVPKIVHLHPPTGTSHLMVDRFSPYYERSAHYNVSNVRPQPAYFSAFPPHADLDKIAYHFVAEYDCAHRRSPHITEALQVEVAKWRDEWSRDDVAPPVLAIESVADDVFLLVDSRNRSTTGTRFEFLTWDQARIALCTYQQTETVDAKLRAWALEESAVAMEIDGTIVPLATARPDLIRRFLAGNSPSPASRVLSAA